MLFSNCNALQLYNGKHMGCLYIKLNQERDNLGLCLRTVFKVEA